MRLWLGASVGGALAYLAIRTTPTNATAYALITVAASTFLAGWLVTRSGSLAGIGATFIGATLWFSDVMVRSWLDGSLARSSPDCDPCGFAGYLGRSLIVMVIGLAIFGPLGAVAGWAGAAARHRLSPA